MTQDSVEHILEQARERIARAAISEDAREELEFQAESFVQRFAGQTLEGETLKGALAMFMDLFSIAYRLAVAESGKS